jgi:hypothetical protein
MQIEVVLSDTSSPTKRAIALLLCGSESVPAQDSEGHESDYPSSRDGHRLVWRPAEAGEDVNFPLSVALAGGARRTSRFSVVVRLGRLPPPSYLRDQGGEGDEHSRQSANGAGVHDTSLDFVLIEREPQGGYSRSS